MTWNPPCKISKKFKFISRCLIRDPFLPFTCVNYSLILVMFAVAHPRPSSLRSPWRADAEHGGLWPSETTFTKTAKVRDQAISPVPINSFDGKLHRDKHTPERGNVKCWTATVPSRSPVTVASEYFSASQRRKTRWTKMQWGESGKNSLGNVQDSHGTSYRTPANQLACFSLYCITASCQSICLNFSQNFIKFVN